MAAKSQSIVVEQVFNPRYDSAEGEAEGNHEYNYRVVKAVNHLATRLGAYLTPSQVDSLIGKGVTVTIQQVR